MFFLFNITNLGTALATWKMSACWDAGYDDAYCSFARENFNYAVAENSMKWRGFEPEYNQFNTYEVDNLMDWLAFHNWGVR